MASQAEASFSLENNILEGPKVLFPPGDGNIGKRVLSILKNNPDFVGQVDARTNESCTYAKLADESIRCALWLRKQQIAPGDIIAIYSQGSISVLAPYLSVFYVGATIIVRPPDLPKETTSYYMKQLQPKIIFSSNDSVENLNNILQEEKIDTKIIVLGNTPGFQSFNDIIKEQSLEEIAQFQCSVVDPNDNAVLIMSSGSTGAPKCIQHTYAGVLDRVECFLYYFWEGKCSMVTSSIPAMGGIVSMIYIFASFFTISQYIIMHRPSIEEMCRMIEKYKIQNTDLPSDVCFKLSKSDLPTKYDLSSLKIGILGGSMLRSGVVKFIRRMIPNCQIKLAYGLTEMGVIYVENSEFDGHLCCNAKLKVVDLKSGEVLGPNQTGEFLLKTNCMMKGYYNNPIATKKAIDSEGWFHTGDCGYYNEKGSIHIVGRIELMINYKNKLISPTEIEEFLLTHPDVEDLVVVPVPHDVDGQYPIAFVIKKNDSKITENDLVQFSSKLGDDKILRAGVVFVDEIPFTVTGKLCRKEMLKMLMMKN